MRVYQCDQCGKQQHHALPWKLNYNETSYSMGDRMPLGEQREFCSLQCVADWIAQQSFHSPEGVAHEN